MCIKESSNSNKKEMQDTSCNETRTGPCSRRSKMKKKKEEQEEEEEEEETEVMRKVSIAQLTSPIPASLLRRQP
jgi:hypothetical protein